MKQEEWNSVNFRLPMFDNKYLRDTSIVVIVSRDYKEYLAYYSFQRKEWINIEDFGLVFPTHWKYQNLEISKFKTITV